MRAMRFSILPLSAMLALASCLPVLGDSVVDFSRDILPVLSDQCFACHGPDESHRKAGLRLDKREEATRSRDGIAAIVPHNARASALIRRITSQDPDVRMPPPDAGPPLTGSQQQQFIHWIKQGAPWDRHWSFKPPTRPIIHHAANATHPIDHFVEQKLQARNRTLAPLANPATQLRRLSMDLIGLPPTADEYRAFLANPAPDAYLREVERLLQSPHYGERMAMWWLDAARYADTDGYQQDATRSNWPWRDWVVEAFNRNMPFDRFTIEQFAGDLLTNATPEQILATCFHRNHMTNGEGGRDPEESRIDYVMDRVNTMGTLWLGLTLGCAQCHSHKFDPVSQDDYFRLNAFFNSVDENGKAGSGAKPYLDYESPRAGPALAEAESYFQRQQARRTHVRRAAEKPFASWLDDTIAKTRQGFTPWHPVEPLHLHATEGTRFRAEDNRTIQTFGPNPRQDDYWIHGRPTLSRVTGFRLEVFPHESHTDGQLSRGAQGEFVLTNVKLQILSQGQSQVRDVLIEHALADVEGKPLWPGEKYGEINHTLDDDPRNGWTTHTHNPKQPHVAVFRLADPVILASDERLQFILMQRSTRGDANLGRFRLSVTDQPHTALRNLEPMPLEVLAQSQPVTSESLDPQLRQRLFEQFLADFPPYQESTITLDIARRHRDAMKEGTQAQKVMVLSELDEPRETHVLVRGVWDKKGATVTPQILTAILPSSAQEPVSRLDLARWLIDRDNPLTARVIVNQLWQLMFGAGLVRTPEDFGLQGEQPTHPDLLDWLAVEFMQSGWDIQHIVRLIVTSRTYRQSSDISPELLELDPDNRWLARGARFRYPSWMLHDAVLRVSGLLNPLVGGPPVKPYQPPGVWKENFMGRFHYEPSPGPARYRRTLYAFWRRASAPTFLFDSAQRRVCEVRPRHTNTPLQALTLLNDVTMLEAAHALAAQAQRNHPNTPAGRWQHMALAVLGREFTSEEQQILNEKYHSALCHYQSHPEQAADFLAIGQSVLHPDLDAAQHAAGLLIASTLLNLDEALTHE